MAPSIADLLSAKSMEVMKPHLYPIGTVFAIDCDEKDGITPKGNDLFRNKWFIVLGYNEEEVALGTVVVNTTPNEKSESNLLQFHHPIYRANHPEILNHDSWVNCSKIFRFNPDNFKNFRRLGCFTEEHLEPILDKVRNAKDITPKDKKRFGLL